MDCSVFKNMKSVFLQPRVCNTHHLLLVRVKEMPGRRRLRDRDRSSSVLPRIEQPIVPVPPLQPQIEHLIVEAIAALDANVGRLLSNRIRELKVAHDKALDAERKDQAERLYRENCAAIANGT